MIRGAVIALISALVLTGLGLVARSSWLESHAGCQWEDSSYDAVRLAVDETWRDDLVVSARPFRPQVEVIRVASESDNERSLALPVDACISRSAVLHNDGPQLNVRISLFSSWDDLVEFVNSGTFLASAWHAQLEYGYVAPAFDADLDVGGDETVDFYCSMGHDRCEQYVAMHGAIDCHPVLAEVVSSGDNDREAARDELTAIAEGLIASITPTLQPVPCPHADDDQRDVEFDTTRV